MKTANQGFTLIELLLYVSVVAIVVSGITGLAFLMLQTRAKTRAMNEINYQGEKIVQTISQTLRNAEAVNSPAKGENSGSLSVDVLDSGNDPTIFHLSNDSIVIKEGSAGEINLSNDKVIAEDLSFNNHGLENAPDSISFSFRLSFINYEQRNEYNYSKQFYGTVSLRK